MTIEIADTAGLSDENIKKLRAWRDELQAAKQGKLVLPGSVAQQGFDELDGLISNRDRVHAIFVSGDFVGGLTLNPNESSNLNLIWRHWGAKKTGQAIAKLAKAQFHIKTCTQCNKHSRAIFSQEGISCKEDSPPSPPSTPPMRSR